MAQQSVKKSGLRTPMMTRTAAAARRNPPLNNRHNTQPLQNQNRATPKNRINPRDAFDKYLNMAKEALTQDDKVLAENYFQHADHYYRLILESRPKDPVSSLMTPTSNDNPIISPDPIHTPRTPRSAVKMPTPPPETYHADYPLQPMAAPIFESAASLETPAVLLSSQNEQETLESSHITPPQKPTKLMLKKAQAEEPQKTEKN